jgi:X-Pro dipeptidyl-peptidase
MRIAARGLVAGALTVAAVALSGGLAQAQQGPVLEDGKTKAVYDYRAAIKERVFIPQPGIDADRNGQEDWITIDIIRPSEGGPDNKMPAIIDPSPYYTTLCRGNESQCMADFNGDGITDRWPLFYDNYFVPRGYAYILAQMNGTGITQHGCPHHGGPTDIAGEKSVVDWLNGRVPGYSSPTRNSQPKVADWHNGSSAMIGKSYDGTLANGVAATGVEGLKTIVPISAISSWYNYSRTGGVRHNTNYPGSSLNPQITWNNTSSTLGWTGANANHPELGLPISDRRQICAPVNSDFNNDANVDTGDGDAHGDMNTFWRERDYVKDASKVKASVFIAHGFQDDNVRMDHVGMWWDALKANGVKLKMWLLRAGHEDPFDSDRAVWVDTLHRWFDHELYGIDNGIDEEPAVRVEESANVWANYNSWPIDGTQNVDIYLRATDNPSAPGTLGATPGGGAADTLNYTALNNSSEANLMGSPTGSQANRRVFLSPPLKTDLRLSGTALADIAASLGQTQANISVILAEYGVTQQVSRSDEGVSNLSTRSCWGVSATGTTCEGAELGAACTSPGNNVEHACYLNTTKPLTTTSATSGWRVSRGILDSRNRDSLWFEDASPVTVGEKYHFRFPTMPTEHTFKAGSRIGIIVGGTNTGQVQSGQATNNVPVTLDTRISKVTLPIQGGYHAAVAAGLTDPEDVPPVVGDVPADITAETTDPAGTEVTFDLPTATDNEDPSPSVACTPASGSVFPIGTTTVSCVATDANGNESEPKTFNVTVKRLVPVDTNVGGSVPATLSLTIDGSADFGTFVPGVAQTYFASTTANVISTAGDALLSVSDPSSFGTGHLVNGDYILPQPLQARARNAANQGTAYNNVGSSASPLNLLTWSSPISNDAVSLEFSQNISATDPLRTGTYSKSLTFTLSTTTP